MKTNQLFPGRIGVISGASNFVEVNIRVLSQTKEPSLM